VQKYGGTSVDGPDRVRAVAGRVAEAHAAGHDTVVVVSAMGHSTDELIALAHRVSPNPSRRELDMLLTTGERVSMALLAMDQLAWAVAGLRQGFVVGATEEALRAALGHGSVAVWAPYALIAERTDIEESWRLTSDSLALWLAGRIGAERCYLIKSIARPRTQASASQLAQDGIVDAAFPGMLKDIAVPAFLLGRGDQKAFAAELAGTGAEAEFCGAEIA